MVAPLKDREDLAHSLIYDLLRAIRAAGLTDEEIADSLDVCPRSLTRWRKGHTAPSFASFLGAEQLLEEILDDDDGEVGADE